MSFSITTAVSSANRNQAVRDAVHDGHEFVLFVYPDTAFTAPDALHLLDSLTDTSAKDVAALAARVLPYGPDWHCSPITLEADCMQLDCVALRCSAVLAVGGFDVHLGGSQAEADLCWRLRGAGYKLLYCPQITAERPTETPAADLAEYVRHTVDSCILRAKYGHAGQGVQTLVNTLRSPRHYPGVRKQLLRALPGAALRTAGTVLRSAPKAAREIVAQNSALDLDGWAPQRGRCAVTDEERRAVFAENPLVSVVIRTCSRPDTLRETLKCLRHQTYINFEVIIVEDGPATARDMVTAEFGDLPIRYHSTGQNVGRGRAGNLGIELAQGTFVSFLDDDDFYYPDFIEQHLAKLLTGDKPGFVISSIMAFEVDVTSRSPYIYTVHKRYPVIFDHITLMDMCVKCRIPMTGGMFLRSLYDVCGGMREDIDGDEDWAMWLRYWRHTHRRARRADVPRAVSMFGYPADPQRAAARLAAYEIFDEQMLADPELCFVCDAAEIEEWNSTVAADVAHLANVGGLDALLAEAVRHEALPLPLQADDAPRTLTAKQINRYYWYLVQQFGKEFTHAGS